MAYTLADFVKLNPQYKKGYDPKTKTAYVSNAKTGKQISFLEGQGQQYGLGSLYNDSHTITDPGRLISALSDSTTNTPAQTQTQASYQSPYSEQIGKTLAAIQGRKAFNYDPGSDEGLQAAQENATDAVSRAAARRGMLYSDSNKSQMGKAALALVPQFEQQAFNRYQQQGQTLQDQLNMLMGLENQTYGRYRDTVGDTLNERQLAMSEAGLTGRYQDAPTLSALELQMANDRQAENDAFARQQWQASPEAQDWYLPTYKQSMEADIKNALRSANTPYRSSGSGGSGLTANQQRVAQVEANTNDFIGQLYRFYDPAKARQFLEDNAGAAAVNGVDMSAVIKAMNSRWPEYFENSYETSYE